jgi:hypothetical protein
MIEPSRRHGHFDPRFSILLARADRPTADATAGTGELPGELDWAAFSGRLFPGRRRHDFEVLKAYEAYRGGARWPTEEPARTEAALVVVGAG